MAKKITPAKAATPGLAPTPDPKIALVDDFVALSQLVESFKPTQKRYEAKRKQLLDYSNEFPPDQSVTFRGLNGIVEIGPCGKERQIKSMAAVAKFFGARFYEFCTLALKHIDSEMTAAEREKHLVVKLTGPRSVSASLAITEKLK